MGVTNWTDYTDRGNLASTILDSLADATLSAVSTVLDNGTNKDSMCRVEINLGSLNPTGVPYLELYMVKAPDGSNYEEAPVIGGTDRNTLVDTIPVPTGSATKRVISKRIAMPPCKVALYVGNQLNVSMAASGNTMDVYTKNLTTA